MSVRNILVVGGAGYIGGAVTDALLERGDVNFRVYDNLLYEDVYRKNVDFVFGDIRDTALLEKQLQWADAVIWLAAIVGDGACELEPNLTVEVNQRPVKWLAENYDGRIIFTSTCSVYGAQGGVMTEEAAPRPLSLYAGTKLTAESFLREKNALIFRLGTLYGVGDAHSRVRFDLVVNYMTAYAMAHGEINVFGGDQYRPLLHVKDVANFLIEGALSQQTGLYNLVERNVRMLDLAQEIINHFPGLSVKVTDRPFQDTRNYQVSGDRARELGFATQHTVDQAVAELKHLMESKKIKYWSDDRYSNEKFLKAMLEKARQVPVAV